MADVHQIRCFFGVGGAAESQNGCNGRAIRVRIVRVTAPVATALGPPSLGSGGGRCFSQIVIPSKDRVPAASPSAARMVRRRLRLFGGGAGTPQLNRLIRPFRPRRRLYAVHVMKPPGGFPTPIPGKMEWWPRPSPLRRERAGYLDLQPPCWVLPLGREIGCAPALHE